MEKPVTTPGSPPPVSTNGGPGTGKKKRKKKKRPSSTAIQRAEGGQSTGEQTGGSSVPSTSGASRAANELELGHTTKHTSPTATEQALPVVDVEAEQVSPPEVAGGSESAVTSSTPGEAISTPKSRGDAVGSSSEDKPDTAIRDLQRKRLHALQAYKAECTARANDAKAAEARISSLSVSVAYLTTKLSDAQADAKQAASVSSLDADKVSRDAARVRAEAESAKKQLAEVKAASNRAQADAASRIAEMGRLREVEEQRAKEAEVRAAAAEARATAAEEAVTVASELKSAKTSYSPDVHARIAATEYRADGAQKAEALAQGEPQASEAVALEEAEARAAAAEALLHSAKMAVAESEERAKNAIEKVAHAEKRVANAEAKARAAEDDSAAAKLAADSASDTLKQLQAEVETLQRAATANTVEAGHIGPRDSATGAVTSDPFFMAELNTLGLLPTASTVSLSWWSRDCANAVKQPYDHLRNYFPSCTDGGPLPSSELTNSSAVPAPVLEAAGSARNAESSLDLNAVVAEKVAIIDQLRGQLEESSAMCETLLETVNEQENTIKEANVSSMSQVASTLIREGTSNTVK